jgi:DNA-binding response OmpR family regulator
LARLLIVDDDPGVVQTFAQMLRLDGHEVMTALGGEAALRALDVSPADAVLVDLRMPDTDGVALLRQLRSHAGQHDMPVAIVTGDYFVDETTVSELRQLGADVYLKPLWFEDLILIVRRLLPTSP